MDGGSYTVQVQARRDCFGVVTKDILTKKVAKPLLLLIWGEMVTKNRPITAISQALKLS